MTPEQVKARFDELASYLWKAYEELGSLAVLLTRRDDQRAAEAILTDLVWAMENCTVIGLHQIGKALEDDMGYGSYDDFDLYEERSSSEVKNPKSWKRGGP